MAGVPPLAPSPNHEAKVLEFTEALSMTAGRKKLAGELSYRCIFFIFHILMMSLRLMVTLCSSKVPSPATKSYIGGGTGSLKED